MNFIASLLLAVSVQVGELLTIPETAEEVERFAGEDVTHFNFRRIHRFYIVPDRQALLTLRNGRAWLVQVGPPCTDYDLRNAQSLHVPSPERINRLNRTDLIEIDQRECEIERIRKFDLEGFKAEHGRPTAHGGRTPQ